ncbi:MAG TPA: hypothetical protein VF848_01825 [Steroidobacteraceae bacterium]
MLRPRAIIIGFGISALGLAGCNGVLGDLGTTTTPTKTNASPTGIWNGTDSVSNLQLAAIINSSGQAYFYRSDGVIFAGVIQVAGTTLAAAVDGYTVYPLQQFADGSTYGVGTLNGTVTTGGTMTTSLSFTTDGGTAVDDDWSLTYSPLSSDASSLAAITGNYRDTDAAPATLTGATLSVSGAGALSAQVAANGCVLNGTATTDDASFDVYQISYTLASCTGEYAVLNGVQFSGLAIVNTSASPTDIVLAVSGKSTAGVNYAIWSVLNLT